MTAPLLNPEALVRLVLDDPAARGLLVAALRDDLGQLAPAAAASPFMNAEEAAVFLRTTRRRVYRLADDGRLPRHKEGRRVLFARGDVEAIAEGRPAPGIGGGGGHVLTHDRRSGRVVPMRTPNGRR